MLPLTSKGAIVKATPQRVAYLDALVRLEQALDPMLTPNGILELM
ncbi:MAG TPA: hypothetical protein VGY58_01910 [Gemmataceae bacterium]|jgi:hypothetical protein|nr:hypothetical protein [Gemmataceae bacterium]